MDTTQKNREETVQRRSRQEAPKGDRKRPPQSAKKTRPGGEEVPRRRPEQQGAVPAPKAEKTGGVKTEAAEGQSAPQKTKQRPKQEAPARRRPAQQGAAPRAGKTGSVKTETAEGQSTPQRAKQRPKQEAPARQGRDAAPQKRQTQSKKKTAPRQQSGKKRQVEPTDLSAKKRAYGNSKPKKKSTLAVMVDLLISSVQKSKARSRARKEARGKTSRTQLPTPAIIYTEPKAFNRTRLLVQLLTVSAIVAALVMGMSVFFKIEKITVTGAEVYSAWTVREASGISEGDGLLTFSQARASAQIKANLPYVNKVRFGIKLPDTVNIIIEEEDVVYAIKDNVGTWWLMNSKGRIVTQAKGSKTSTYTQILGVTLENPSPNTQAVATEATPISTDETGEAIPVAVTGAQRLNAAMEIVQALEANDIVGEAASVDVTRIEDIILWYGTRYQVGLGDASNLEYKITCMNDAILQLSEYQSGILDISFTIWPNQVGYTPFA